ncbi:MAG: hypothetical protein IJX28_01095 [Clostridia bacterium]|nr:hypothetical protein [Clostridia bacterium]
MAYYNEQLQQLREKIERKKQLRATVKELDAQRATLSLRVEELAWLRQREELDVERLEGKSFAAFFYTVLGKREEKLDREQAELCAAVAKYESALTSLEQVKAEIHAAEAELESLAYCEEELEKMLQKKRDAIKASGSADGEELLTLEPQIARLKHQDKELTEARHAGETALQTAKSVRTYLEKAKGWGIADLLSDGVVADVLKHNNLYRAKEMLKELQEDLRRFKTELADVPSIYTVDHIETEDFLGVADFFFDCVFVDLDMQMRIKEYYGRIDETVLEIAGALERMERLQSEGREQRIALEQRLQILEERNTI